MIPQCINDELARLHDVLKTANGVGWQDRRKWAQDRITAIHKAWFESPPNSQYGDEELVMKMSRPEFTAEHIAAALDLGNDMRFKDYETKTNE